MPPPWFYIIFSRFPGSNLATEDIKLNDEFSVNFDFQSQRLKLMAEFEYLESCVKMDKQTEVQIYVSHISHSTACCCCCMNCMEMLAKAGDCKLEVDPRVRCGHFYKASGILVSAFVRR